MGLNNKAFDALIDWLDAGAPEYIFSMNHSVFPADQVWLDNSWNRHIVDELERKPDCGSVCCIAGWAAQQRAGQLDQFTPWEEIQTTALKFLGLPPTDTDLIPLFDPEYAPTHCTPHQAAEAVRDFRDNWNGDVGYNPWP